MAGKKDEILNLNVGGKKFTVRRSDLCADPRSRLAEWFRLGVNRPIPQDKQGNYFLDRDGRTFRYVLFWLRMRRERVVSPMLSLPMKPDVISHLLAESEALGLDELRNDCLDLLQAYQRDEMGQTNVAYVNRVVHMYGEFSFEMRALPGDARGPRSTKKPLKGAAGDSFEDWDA